MAFQEFAVAVRKACEKAKEAGLPFEEEDFERCPIGHLFNQEGDSWEKILGTSRLEKTASAFGLSQAIVWGFVWGFDGLSKEKAFDLEKKQASEFASEIQRSEFFQAFELGETLRKEFLLK